MEVRWVRMPISVAFIMIAALAWAPPRKALGGSGRADGWLHDAGLLMPTAAVAVDNHTRRVFAVNMVEGSLSVLDGRSGALLHRLDMDADFLPGPSPSRRQRAISSCRRRLATRWKCGMARRAVFCARLCCLSYRRPLSRPVGVPVF